MKKIIKKDTSNIVLSERLSTKIIENSIENLKAISFELTESCNLACEYCAYGVFYDTDKNRKKRDMPFLYIKNALDYIISVKENKISKEFDTNKIHNYLQKIQNSNIINSLADSLKKTYKINIKLKPTFFRKINTEKLYSNSLNKISNPKFTVYIISKFNCSACINAKNKLNLLIKKYKDRISFKHVYYNDYITKKAKACEAAKKQNKYTEMYNTIWENDINLDNDSIIYNFAKQINLKISTFKDDIHNVEILKPLLLNKSYLLDNGIITTPSFIVDRYVLDGKYSINYLEDVIIKQLNKNH